MAKYLYSYIDLKLTDAERDFFCKVITDWQTGAAMKWLACNDEGVLLECERRVVVLTWKETQNIMTHGTYTEIKNWNNEVSEIVNNNLLKFYKI